MLRDDGAVSIGDVYREEEGFLVGDGLREGDQLTCSVLGILNRLQKELVLVEDMVANIGSVLGGCGVVDGAELTFAQ